ncbi:MAG: biosynthetic-type acetolactate synthase large subunit [Chitinivibrionales bacterium]
MKLTGAQFTIATLEYYGIETIAGIPGGSNLPLYDALRSSSIRHILARHEQGAGFIAQGMARSTGRPAVCFATSGPGATNLLTALADAKMDSVPVVAITGQVPTSYLGTDAFQEVDICAMAAPVTRFCIQVKEPEELYRAIPRAFEIAMGPRPGPVLIDIPKDVQKKVFECDTFPPYPAPGKCICVHEEKLTAIANEINAAQRPFMYIGGGIINSGASDILRRFAEKTNIPIASTLMGLGAIESDHPLFMGMLGMHGAQFVNRALAQSDLILAFGVRFDDRAIGNHSDFCPEARIVHIDIDDAQIDKICRSNIGLQADIGWALERLIGLVGHGSLSNWHSQIGHLRQTSYDHMDSVTNPDHPLSLIATVGALAGKDTIVTTDVGQHQMWVAQAYPFKKPATFLTSGGLGTMGFGLPAAIGAALANPGREVICFTGDGSLLMNIQELATLAELDLNVKIVLLNNETLGLVKQQQELFYDGRSFASSFDAGPDFTAIAANFGIKGFRLERQDERLADLTEALVNPGPSLIEIAIGAQEMVFPMVPPGGANHSMICKRKGIECL